MKMKFLFLLGTAMAFAMFACTEEPIEKPETHVSTDPPPPGTIPPDEPEFMSSVPTYPVLTFHILQREYYFVKENDFVETNGYISWPNYLEMRLVQLYPESAYQGMVQEDINNFNTYKVEYNQFIQNWIDYEVAIGIPIDSVTDTTNIRHPFVDLADEIDFLDMTWKEVNKWNYYDSLITIDTITRHGLDTLVDINHNQSNKRIVGVAVLSTISGAAAIANFAYWRIEIARERALDRTDLLYDDGPNGAAGKVSDAFKHIYVSLLLNSYLGYPPAANIIMRVYEERNPNDFHRETVMDLHNNRIGRLTRFWKLRGTSLSWKTWATRTKDWVDDGPQNPTNNRYNGHYTDWKSTDPDLETAKTERKSIDQRKFIYFDF